MLAAQKTKAEEGISSVNLLIPIWPNLLAALLGNSAPGRATAVSLYLFCRLDVQESDPNAEVWNAEGSGPRERIRSRAGSDRPIGMNAGSAGQASFYSR
jgi:hypothetical protein